MKIQPRRRCSMTEPTIQQEARIYGNRLVKPGDKVKILPVNLMKQNYKKDGEYFAKTEVVFLQEWLGEDPLTISWIGRWPCGRIMLYFKGGKSDGAGAYAYDFM